jgi:hypothetical protein
MPIRDPEVRELCAEAECGLHVDSPARDVRKLDPATLRRHVASASRPV